MKLFLVYLSLWLVTAGIGLVIDPALVGRFGVSERAVHRVALVLAFLGVLSGLWAMALPL